MFNSRVEPNVELDPNRSNLGRLCEAKNEAGDFMEIRGHHQIIENQSLVRAHQVSKLARILIRLVNDTFLALPIEQCRPLTPLASAGSDDDQSEPNKITSPSDACLINWNKTRLVNLHEFNSSSSSRVNFLDNQQNNNITNDNTTNFGTNFNNFISENKSSTSSSSSLSLNTTQIDFTIVKLTYLSISSLLSILGILINLFIILIIIFNTKQKRRSVIRSNNTNQNNLLLLQLTLTGILLSSYVLLENNQKIQSHQHHLIISKFPQDQERFSSFYASQYSPLFNFLPASSSSSPSSYLRTSTIQSSNNNNNNRGGFKCHQNHNHQQLLGFPRDEEEEAGRSTESSSSISFKFHHDESHHDPFQLNHHNHHQNFALILDFNSPTKKTTTTTSQPADDSDASSDVTSHTEAANERRRGSWYLEYYVLNGGGSLEDFENKTRLIELTSESLAMISVGSLNCLNGSWLRQEEAEVKQDAGSNVNRSGQQNSESLASNDLDTTTNQSKAEFLILLMGRLLPLCMNVIASIHIWTVAALAYDRYCAIAHPLQYLRSIHTSRVRKFFLLSWSISILLNLLWPLAMNQIISHQHHNHEASLLSFSVNHSGGEEKTWPLMGDDLHLLPIGQAPSAHLINGSNQTTTTREFSKTPTLWINCPTQDVNNNSSISSCIGPGYIYQAMRSLLVQVRDNLNAHKTEAGGCYVSSSSSSEKNKSSSAADKLALESAKSMAEHLWVQQMRNSLTIQLTSLILTDQQPPSRSNLKSLGINNNNNNNNATSSPKVTQRIVSEPEMASNLYIILLLIYSLLIFVMIILAPLLIITTCNIMIYRIVKVHERRLSINSGSNVNTSASNLNYNHNYQIHHHHHNHQLIGHHNYHHHQHDIHHQKLRNRRDPPVDQKAGSETSSMASLVVAKLINFGFLKGPTKSQARGQDEDTEAAAYCSPNQPPQNHCLSNNCCNKHCDCDTTRNSSNPRLDCQINNNNEQDISTSSIVNRSKRMIIRQDSYQIVAKLQDRDELCNRNFDKSPQDDQLHHHQVGGVTRSCNRTNPVVVSPPHYNSYQRSRIKRKASDHTLRDFHPPRKDSNTSQLSDLDYATDNFSLFNDSPVANNNSDGQKICHEPSDGIMNQLKLAGLSFAGIAIQESASPALSGFNFGKPSLLKSTSCSLASLNTNIANHLSNHNTNNYATSVSRCSMETSSSLHTCPRKSYMSLHYPFKQQQQHDLGQCRNLTKLMDDESDSSQPPPPALNPQYSSQNSARLSTLGTKSPAFNFVIWLIMSLLIFTIPHYILETVHQVRRFNHVHGHNVVDAQMYQQPLTTMVEFILGWNSESSLDVRRSDSELSKFLLHNNDPSRVVHSYDTSGDGFWVISSICLSYICRILFLSIVPLNGWLYGIRSRSLRATLRIVLRHYISRRQASIEINQRQRSISSIRSKDSSFIMNLPPLYYNQNNTSCLCPHCNCRLSSKSPERIIRRCSSFNGTRLENRLHDTSILQPFAGNNMNSVEEIKLADGGGTQTRTPVINFKDINNSSNTIRFLPSDSGSDNDPDNLLPKKPNQQLADNITQYFSQNVSPTLSLTGSDRSLVSASIHSAHSILFDDRRLQDLNSNRDRKSSNQHRISPIKLAQDVSELEQASKVGVASQSSNDSSGSVVCRELSSQEHSPNLNRIDHHFQTPTATARAKVFHGHRSTGSTNSMESSCTDLDDCHDNRQLRKSSGDFRFVITPADQKQHVLEFNQEGKLTPKMDIAINFLSNGSLQTNLAESSGKQITSDWWKELKVNLTKIVTASARLLPNNSIEAERRTMPKVSNGRNDWMNSSHQAEAEDQCRKALLRKSSIDSRTSGWHQNLVIDKFESNSSSLIPPLANKQRKRRKGLRNSLTLNNIGSSSGNDKFSSHHAYSNHQAKYKNNGNNYSDRNSSTKTLDSSPIYLKPPNFLKLIFDHNNHNNPFSGSSALSPIKECSSNHSFASSQSSINHTNHMLNNFMKNSSMGETNSMMEQSDRRVEN